MARYIVTFKFVASEEPGDNYIQLLADVICQSTKSPVSIKAEQLPTPDELKAMDEKQQLKWIRKMSCF